MTRHYCRKPNRRPVSACLLMASSVLVGLLAANSHALPEDADKPITIRADSMQGDQRNNRAIYTGAVQVDQGTLRVNADRMVVEVENQKVTKITFNGAPARYQQQLNADEDQVRARASTIVYYTQSERLDLKGDAYLTQEGNEVTGELIEYDIVAGKVNASSTPEEGPIRMILQPAREN